MGITETDEIEPSMLYHADTNKDFLTHDPIYNAELTSEGITPRPITPTFGYTKEKHPHSVGSWFRRLVGGASWGIAPAETSRGRGG